MVAICDVKKMKVQELRDELSALGLETTGLKAELVDRLLAALGGAPAGEDGAPAGEEDAEEDAAAPEAPEAAALAEEPAAEEPVVEADAAAAGEAEPVADAPPAAPEGEALAADAAGTEDAVPGSDEPLATEHVQGEDEQGGNNKRKAEEGGDGDGEEGPLRKRASFNGPGDDVDGAEDPVTNGEGDEAMRPQSGFDVQPTPEQAAAAVQAAAAAPMAAAVASPTDFVDIPSHMVGKIIGKGGETIKQLQYSTNTRIQIDHITAGETKRVTISGNTQEYIDAAKREIETLISSDDARGVGEVTQSVDCPQGIVGRIIGRGGETIRALQQASQAHIVVQQDFPEGVPRKVNVSGRADAVERAVKMVAELINGEPGSAQAIIQKYGAGVSRSVDCPKQMVGRVIGKGGETIKALQKQFQANIQIDQSSDPMRITIAGQPTAVDAAHVAVQEIINGGNPFGPGPLGGGPSYGAAAPYGAPAYGAPAYGAPAYGAPAYGGYQQPAPAYGGYGYGAPAYGGYAQPAAAPYGGYGGYQQGADPYAQGGYGAGGYGGAAQAPAAGGAWQELQDNEGRTYYYNSQTGVSQWEKPADA